MKTKFASYGGAPSVGVPFDIHTNQRDSDMLPTGVGRNEDLTGKSGNYFLSSTTKRSTSVFPMFSTS